EGASARRDGRPAPPRRRPARDDREPRGAGRPQFGGRPARPASRCAREQGRHAMTPRRNAAAVVAMTLLFSVGMAMAGFVPGSASAASSKTTTAKKKSTTTTSTTVSSTKATTTSTTTKTTQKPEEYFSVVNGTVNAASDHVIVGSSAFPNFAKGAVDNYYAMA